MALFEEIVGLDSAIDEYLMYEDLVWGTPGFKAGCEYVVGYCRIDGELGEFRTRAAAEGEDPEKMLRESWAEFLKQDVDGTVLGVVSVAEGKKV